MPQDCDELSGMSRVVPPHSRSDIIDDHIAQLLWPMLAME